MKFKKERNTEKVCDICGEDFNPDELGHYECKTIQDQDESTTLLECPKCSHISKVYHLDWYAVVCEGCSEEVKLTEFKEKANA
tara:strand:+ start:2544 stop:2792 length:249 start_codon:yes stop_codon:yes gene_type:complete